VLSDAGQCNQAHPALWRIVSDTFSRITRTSELIPHEPTHDGYDYMQVGLRLTFAQALWPIALVIADMRNKTFSECVCFPFL
jgi:hypothetical protein